MNNEVILDEIVDVVAVFAAGREPCRPVRFRRKSGREVTISEIGLRFPRPQGSKMIHVYDVTDGQADYRLEFDAVSLVWRLVREADHVA